MRLNPDFQCEFTEGLAADAYAAGNHEGASVDHKEAPCVSFFISVGDVGTGGTVDAKVQYSDNNSTWTDETTGMGNDTSITQITAAGTAQLNVVNPRARYSRVYVTVATDTCNVGIVNVLGPLRSKSY